MASKSFKIGNVQVGLNAPFAVMAGPCVIEGYDVCLKIAQRLNKISQTTGVPIVFKGSFDKANRTSIDSFRGPGLDEGLKILDKIRSETGMAIMTDIHESSQAAAVGQVVDCLQIPAFLCRQTDLLVAAGNTGKAISVKKGQFVSPSEMKNAVSKVRSTGNEKIMLAERGTFFGYGRLVNDMTCINDMQQLGCPVIFDATHSTQQPGGLGNASGGRPQMAKLLAKSAVAAGANMLFLEVHTEPSKALCDAACIMDIDWVEDLIKKSKAIFEIIRS